MIMVQHASFRRAEETNVFFSFLSSCSPPFLLVEYIIEGGLFLVCLMYLSFEVKKGQVST